VAVAVKAIKNRIDILDVISSDVDLTKKGPHYWGLCPFHGEKTPSFTVNRDKQRAVCYGCGWSGDIIAYVMKRDNLTFKEALAILGERAGISTTVELTPAQIRKSKQAANQRQLVEIKTAKLKKILWQEYKRLIDIEDWAWRILRTVTGPGDYNRPAVVWALNVGPIAESLLNEWHCGNDVDKLELLSMTKEVRLWQLN